MSNTAQHTMTPWIAEGSRIVSEANRNLTIARVGVSADGDYSPANAAFIVRACNSNAALVNALQLLADKVEACGGYPAFRDELQHARAALHLAAAGV